MKGIQNITIEQEIVELLEAKDRLGISLLYDHYGDLIYGLIFRISKSEQFAKEALQDTFLNIWQDIDNYKPENGRFLSWVLNIARATVFEMNCQIKEEMLKNQATIPLNSTYPNLTKKISKLEPECKNVMELIYFWGMDLPEVAQELNISIEKVRGAIKQAFKELRTVFD